MALNGVSDLNTTEEPLSSPDTPLFDTTPSSTPTELASPVDPPPDEEERKKLQDEMGEVEIDILALRETLQSKQLRLKEIKRRLGITAVGEMREKAKQSWDNVAQSTAYNKTKTGFQTAGQKTGAAFTSFGSVVSKKLGEMKESKTFKSIGESVSSAATSVKTKVVGQPKEPTFEDALQESSVEAGKDPLDSPTTDEIPLHSDN